MIKPVKMKKINAVILEDKKDAVLRELKEQGTIHFLKVRETDMAKDLKLSPGKTVGINVTAAEYLSKVEGMLEVLKLAKDDGASILQTLTQEPAPPTETTEVSPDELFKTAEDKVSALEERIMGISEKLEELKKEGDDIQNAKDVMEKLKPLDISPVDLEEFKYTFTATGLIATEEIGKLRDEVSGMTDLFFIQSVEQNKKESVILVIAARDVEADVRRIMHIRRVEEFRVPEAFASYSQEDAEKEIGSRLAEIETENGDLLKELKEIKVAEEKDLLILQESLTIEKMMDETNTNFGNTKHSFVLKGWIPAEKADEVVNIIETSSDNHCVVTTEEPTHHEEPPTLLENSGMAQPLEMLTKTYDVPAYAMVDPSLAMSITFPVIFGLMFGDVGQGFVLFLAGGSLGFVFKVDGGIKKLGRILMYCGIAAMGGGLLYGEVFGLEGIVPSLWIHPLDSLMTLITFAFYLAIAHVSLGCFIKIYDEVAHGKPLHAIVSPWGISGLWLFWGGTYVIKSNGIDGTINHIMGLFSGSSAALGALGPFVIAPFAVIAIGGKFVEGLSLPWAIYEAYEAVSRYLFNSLSYVRVAALATVHSVFALLMNMGLAAVLGVGGHGTAGDYLAALPDAGPVGIILFAGIFIGGNLFIILLETLISFIHTLRLHYYEWFSKFYQGGGTSFKPFMALRKYTLLVPSYSEDK